MAETNTRKILDDRINILDRNAVDSSPAKRVFKTDKMISNEDSIQLSEYCFNVCVIVETAIQGKNVGDLNEYVRMALEALERLLYEIEQTLGRGIVTPHAKYDQKTVEEDKLEIQEILGVLNPQSLPFGGNLSAIGNPTPLAPATAVTESALQRLIKRAFALHELPSLIEMVFSSTDPDNVIRCLCVDDAQTLVDVMDEALPDLRNLSPPIRKKCLKSLYKTCGHHSIIPRALKVPICYDRTGYPLYKGGFADVWKGEHCGRDVAVKVLRVYSTSDLQRIIDRFCKEVVIWKTLQHPNVLPLIGVTMTEAQFAMVSEWMANGSINEFVKANPGADRLGLLGDVARGLIYIHSQAMIHGDLKGANILIDQTGHARLADFGLLTVISDPATLLPSSSYTQGGTFRWLSPELIEPHKFGFEKIRPTKYSDCYALGMVIYETITGHLPFHRDVDLTVIMKVIAGKHPPREAGFTDSLWKMLEHCWTPQPKDRPSIEVVLQCLEGVLDPSEPLSPWADEETDMDSDPASDSSDTPASIVDYSYASLQSGDPDPSNDGLTSAAMTTQDTFADFETVRGNVRSNTVERLKVIIIGLNKQCGTDISKIGKKGELIERITRQFDSWRLTKNEAAFTRAKGIVDIVTYRGSSSGGLFDINQIPQSSTVTSNHSYNSLNPGPSVVSRHVGPYRTPGGSYQSSGLDVIIDGQQHTDDSKYGSVEWITAHPPKPEPAKVALVRPQPRTSDGGQNQKTIIILSSDDEDDEGWVTRKLFPSYDPGTSNSNTQQNTPGAGTQHPPHGHSRQKGNGCS